MAGETGANAGDSKKSEWTEEQDFKKIKRWNNFLSKVMTRLVLN